MYFQIKKSFNFTLVNEEKDEKEENIIHKPLLVRSK